MARRASPRGGPVRVALVGLGWVGRQVWLPALRDDPGFEVSALVEPDEDRLADAARLAPGARAWPSPAPLEEGVAELAVLTMPNDLHAVTAEQLLGRDLSVFVEKPVCLTGAELARLRAAEAASRGVLLAGTASRYRADVRALRSVLPSLGAVRLLELSWVRARGIPRQGGWFCRADRAGGGALVDLGWHLLDVGFELAGCRAVAAACAATSADFLGDARWSAGWRRGDPRVAGAPHDVEDSAAGFVATAEGVGVFVRAAWASHQAHDTTVLAVHGSCGSASLHGTFGFSPAREPGSSLVVEREGHAERVPLPAEEVGAEYRRQLAALPALLRGGEARGRALAEAAPVVAAVEALYAGARAGAEVERSTA